MNCYLDGLVFRTSDHKKLEVAVKYFDKPIINALSNKSHPCQTISDLLTLNEVFNSLNIDILWIGDLNNVCYSLIESANLISELKLFIYTPSDFKNNLEIKLNQNINFIDNLSDIDLLKIRCVMTDVFISMNDKEDENKYSTLINYKVTQELMNKTSKDSVFMHCLPANVGVEVDEEVFRGHKSIVWKQAYNRYVAQKQLLNLIFQKNN